jgi:hypothetical protein
MRQAMAPRLAINTLSNMNYSYFRADGALSRETIS